MKALNQIDGQGYTLYQGDCCELCQSIPDESVHYSIFSPPFASLYTYSNSPRDMGNCKTDDEFKIHFGYLIKELYRVLKPGRLVSIHCMNLPVLKQACGYVGIHDFRGEIIRWFQSAGFIFSSEVCIWKCPVVAMQRTKSIRLLHKQMVKDSTISGQGIPDYLVTMRKPGENPEPVSGELAYFVGDKTTFKSSGKLSIDIWQKYASPVWMDINPSNTLQFRAARDANDERHICPLQLDVIERGVQLWSNPDDVVFSPFMGIGSEGYVAVKAGRKFIGIELKDTYFQQAAKNMALATVEANETKLFR